MTLKAAPTGALIYVRVSTDEQASGAYNLQNQERRCHNFCQQNGFDVVSVFVDPGESARSTDRPEFQKMLRFCKEYRKQIGYIVVQDLSRFARNLQDQAQTINQLRTLNIRVRSTYEPNIDETAAGKLAANIFGTFNQYFSDALSEKMRDRARASVRAGRYPWPAPIGYLNQRGQTGPNIIPDPKRADLVRRAFELIAASSPRSEVLRVITEMGLRTRKNKPLSAQTFHSMLQKPVYCGWIAPPSMDGLRVQGSHVPLVSEEVFLKVQDVLSGRKRPTSAKRRFNASLPLKWFVKCGHCETPLTGGFAVGRGRKRYGRYWCRNSHCRGVSQSKAKLEAEFTSILKRLQPNKQIVSKFPTVAAKVWSQKLGDADKEQRRLTSKLENVKHLKSELLRQKLEGKVAQQEYDEAIDQFKDEIAELDQKIELNATSKATLDSFVRFAELMLVDIAGAWQKAKPEQRQRVQNLLFPAGVLYSTDNGFLNRVKSSLFSVLDEIRTEEGMLASPTGFEPVLPP